MSNNNVSFCKEAKNSFFGAVYHTASPHLITRRGDHLGIMVLKMTGGTVALAGLAILQLAEMVARAALSVLALLIFPFIPSASTPAYKDHFFDPVLRGTFESGFGFISALAHTISNLFPKA